MSRARVTDPMWGTGFEEASVCTEYPYGYSLLNTYKSGRKRVSVFFSLPLLPNLIFYQVTSDMFNEPIEIIIVIINFCYIVLL